MNTTTGDKVERIRALNDHLRITFTGGKVMLTAGIDALPPDKKASVLSKVRTFDFNNDNDPHKEPDFGAFEGDGERFLSRSTAYQAVPTRVVTIMRAEEF